MTVEVTTALISVISSLIVAVITAIITSKFTLRREISKSIYTKREEAYISLFDLMQRIRDEPYYIFNRKEIVQPFKDLRTKINLYATQSVIDILEPFYIKANSIYDEYAKHFLSEEHYIEQSAREDYGETALDLQHEEDRYMESHLIDAEYISITIAKLVEAIRTDLKTK
jgi:hypothetical protein